MIQTKYGIDAPGLVKSFLIVSVLSGAIGFGGLVLEASKPWVVWLAGACIVVATYALGMFFLMLWESLVTKVRGRDSILNLIDWTGDERVLDVGCGRGLLLVGVAHRLTTGHAIGVDIWLNRDQSSNVVTAPLENARLEWVADRVSVETADMRALPFPDGIFDVVVSSWTIHNLHNAEDRGLALSEIVRVLRPGGSVLVNDISLRHEYQTELRRLGLGNVEIIIESKLRDIILGLVSFGAFRPATVIGKKMR